MGMAGHRQFICQRGLEFEAEVFAADITDTESTHLRHVATFRKRKNPTRDVKKCEYRRRSNYHFLEIEIVVGKGCNEVIEHGMKSDTERINVIRSDRNELVIILVLGIDKCYLLSGRQWITLGNASRDYKKTHTCSLG